MPFARACIVTVRIKTGAREIGEYVTHRHTEYIPVRTHTHRERARFRLGIGVMKMKNFLGIFKAFRMFIRKKWLQMLKYNSKGVKGVNMLHPREKLYMAATWGTSNGMCII